VGDLFQPIHIVVIAGIIVVVVLARKGYFSGRSGRQAQFQGQNQSPRLQQATEDSDLPALKYCTECGKQIKRRAEICPLCGCRRQGCETWAGRTQLNFCQNRTPHTTR
jgi:hypothetical protein